MVNYDYRNLFKQRHIPKDMIIVDIGATVTKNSGHAPTITGETYIFRTEDLQTESFELEESLCSEENLKWGLCEAAKVTVSVVNKPDYPTLKDEMFDVYIYMNGDSDTLLQIGRYRVETDTYSDDRRFRDLAMYDLLYYLRDYDITPWYEEMYDPVEGSAFWDVTELVNSLFTWLNEVEEIPISWTSRTLPNGSFQIEKTIEADTITFEFFMQKILEINGAFGHINRKGKFVFVWLDWYDQPAVETIVDDWRKPPTTYKDQFTWGIGYIRYYDKNNINIFGDIGSSDKKHPSIYNIVDSFVFEGYEPDSNEAKTALTKMHQKIWHCRYKPFECECAGDPTIEVGDRIDVQYGTDENNQPLTFYSYVLERRFKGIKSFRDTYSAQGNKKQPKYKIDNDNWHIGDSEEGSYGYGGISTVNVDPNNFVEIIRNIGFRLLDEPSDVVCEYDSDNGIVKLLWSDPADIATSEPCEAEWAGTVVVRKENTPPLHRWDGTLIVNSTTRDQYSQSYLVNNNIEANKHYYYGIFPYDTKGDYRYTKVLSVNTGEKVLAPTISDVSMSGSKVVVTYSIPDYNYSYIKLVYKKGSIPASYTDGTAVDITQSSTSKTITGIADGGRYYFVIFTDKSTSEPKDIVTEGTSEVIISFEDAAIFASLNDTVDKYQNDADLFMSEFTSLIPNNRNKILYVGRMPSRHFYAESDYYTYSNNSGDALTQVAFPLMDMTRIKQIKFKYKLTQNGQYSYIGIWAAYWNGTTFVKVYGGYIQTATSNWVEQTINILNYPNANYLLMEISQGKGYLKDIIFVYEEE